MRTSWKLWIAALAALLLAAPAFAQTGSIKGTAKDVQGNPMAGATVQLVSPETGRKYEVKTGKNGEFQSLGIAGGTYTINLIQNGKTIYSMEKYPIGLVVNTIDLDLSKVAAQQGQPKITEQQKKEMEEIKKHNEEAEKENVKIKGLNDMLAQARTAEQAGNPQQAVQILTQATQQDATKDLLWANLAEAQKLAAKSAPDSAGRKQGYDASVDSFKKAIAIKPTPAYYNNMADSMGKAGDFAGAIQAFDQAASLDPANSATYYYNEGAVLTNAGKTDEALTAFDKAIKANPNQAEAYYQKGVTLMAKATVDSKTGKITAPPEAAEAFNKYLALAPSGPNAQNAKDLLTSLGATVETQFGKTKARKK